MSIRAMPRVTASFQKIRHFHPTFGYASEAAGITNGGNAVKTLTGADYIRKKVKTNCTYRETP